MQNYQIVVPNWFKVESLKVKKNKSSSNKREADVAEAALGTPEGKETARATATSRGGMQR